MGSKTNPESYWEKDVTVLWQLEKLILGKIGDRRRLSLTKADPVESGCSGTGLPQSWTSGRLI